MHLLRSEGTGALRVESRRCIAIEEGRVTAVAAPGSIRPAPGELLVRGNGRWLMPALVDARVERVSAPHLRLMAVDGVLHAGVHGAEQRCLLRDAFGDSGGAASVHAPPSPDDGWVVPSLAASRRAIDPPRLDAPSVHPPALRRHWVSQAPATEGDHARIVRRVRTARPDRVLAGSALGAPAVEPGAGLVDEVLALIEVGLPAGHALAAASSRAAVALGLESHGAVGVGSAADLLLLDSDPTLHPETLRRPALVVAGGRPIRRAEQAVIRSRVASATVRIEDAAPDGVPFATDDSIEVLLAMLDGLPFAIRLAATRAEPDGTSLAWRRERWEPLWSTTEGTVRFDRDDRWTAATIRHDAPVDPFVMELEREPGTLAVSLAVAGGARVEHRWPIEEDVVLLIDDLPFAPDLRRFRDRPPGAEVPVVEVEFGSGGIRLRRDRWRRTAEPDSCSNRTGSVWSTVVRPGARGSIGVRGGEDGRIHRWSVSTPFGRSVHQALAPLHRPRTVRERGEEGTTTGAPELPRRPSSDAPPGSKN